MTRSMMTKNKGPLKALFYYLIFLAKFANDLN